MKSNPTIKRKEKHLKGGGPVQLGSICRFRRNVGYVCYELLQEVAALLQVGGVNDHLHQLWGETQKWTHSTTLHGL